MDKNIIIDGVNVAGCEFAVKPINDNRIKCHCVKGLLQIAKMHEQPESVKSGLCENNPDCYYKQLKRLEQENKELKEKNKTLNYQWHKQSEIGDEWYKVADKYKTALEEIQKTIKSYELAVDNGASVDTLYTIGKIINEVLK